LENFFYKKKWILKHQTKMKAHIKMKIYFTLIIGLSLLIMNVNLEQDSTSSQNMPDVIEAAGEFSPSGEPQKKPERIEAGKSCFVDLIQSYTISGTLSGKIVFNYRILIKGPCGSPPGTFDEEWIAYGKFDGKFNNNSAFGKMSYTAEVKAGGELNGIIVLGQGLNGQLQVYGNFKDGKLSYKGQIK
jgi:hypothetical protein